MIETPHGYTQVEIRMMYVWTDRLRAVLPLLRMERGKMMGVDHNKGLRWVGASAGLVGSAIDISYCCTGGVWTNVPAEHGRCLPRRPQRNPYCPSRSGRQVFRRRAAQLR